MELGVIKSQLLADQNSRVCKIEYSTNVNGDLDTSKWVKTEKVWFSNGIYLVADKYLSEPPEDMVNSLKMFINRINNMTFFDRLTYQLNPIDLIDELGLSNAIIVNYDQWIDADSIDFENNNVYYLNPYENELYLINLSDGFAVWEKKVS